MERRVFQVTIEASSTSSKSPIRTPRGSSMPTTTRHCNLEMDRKDFRMRVEETFAWPVLRQAFEGCAINWSLDLRNMGARLELLNSKSEFNQPGTVRPQMS